MLKKADIEDYLAKIEEVKELRRRASTLAKLADETADEIAAYVRKKGGSDRTCRFQGFVLALLDGRASVSWKKEFVAIAGDDSAELLIKAAPLTEVLSVTPVEG